jgi:regulator of cell morphogenesis and NO signaling
MEHIEPTTTIAEIVNQNIRTAPVFKKYGLDFCCGGNKELSAACEERGADMNKVLAELDLVFNASKPEIDFEAMPANELVQYITDKHHAYIYSNGPVTAELIDKVARVHGERHPETIEIANLFKKLLSDLHHHMVKEEQILFPYILKLTRMDSKDLNLGQITPFVANPIRVMEMEHDDAGNMLNRLNELSRGYSPPSDGCNSFKAAYAQLEDMENDIHMHVHLENNVLFPKAVQLEKKLTE